MRFPDGPIRQELESFEYEYTGRGVRYSAPQGVHDDCVMALALAVHHHTARASRIDRVDLMTPPSEERMAQLIAEEMAMRDRCPREALAKSGMTMGDLDDDERGWKPLGVTMGKLRGF